MLQGLSCIFPSDDMQKTADYYEQKLSFRQVRYVEAAEPHICLYRDNTEIILTQTRGKHFEPNRARYGYGYDAYFYTREPARLQAEFAQNGVNIARALATTDYQNREFVIEDIDGRWIGFGYKE